MRRAARIFLACLVAACLLYIGLADRHTEPAPHPRDYDEIAAEGILRATMEYNGLNLHAAGDTVAGFYYELIEAFARDHELHVSVTPEMSVQRRLEGLLSGQYDIVANGIPATAQLKDTLLFTLPIQLGHSVLVQRKPLTHEDSLKYISTQIGLARKTIHITRSPSLAMRLQHLAEEIGDTIYTVEVERYGGEQLVAMVAYGDIDYAVCDADIAALVADSLPQIDISLPIGFTQFYSWAVNKQSPALLDSLNAWLQRRNLAYPSGR